MMKVKRILNKICGQWFDYLDHTFQASFTIGLFAMVIVGFILLLFYIIVSPIFMWIPSKEVEHPTLLDYFCEASDIYESERKEKL